MFAILYECLSELPDSKNVKITKFVHRTWLKLRIIVKNTKNFITQKL